MSRHTPYPFCWTLPLPFLRSLICILSWTHSCFPIVLHLAAPVKRNLRFHLPLVSMLWVSAPHFLPGRQKAGGPRGSVGPQHACLAEQVCHVLAFTTEGADCSCRRVFGNERRKVTVENSVEADREKWRKFVERWDRRNARRQEMTCTYPLSIREN